MKINQKKIEKCVDTQQATCDTYLRLKNGLADRAEPGTRRRDENRLHNQHPARLLRHANAIFETQG